MFSHGNLQRYPEYYEIIKEPIDIRTIAQRIQKGSYPTLDDLVADFTLMISNAKTFNEPGSKVYRVSSVVISHGTSAFPKKNIVQ